MTTTFKDFGRSDEPFNLEKALAALRAELARPRPLGPTIILVRNVQEAERLRALMKEV